MMNQEQALTKAGAVFGKDAIIRQRPCVPMSKPEPDMGGNPVRIKDAQGNPLCSAAPAHGPGCPGGLPVCTIERPNQAGSEFQIIAMGNNWDEIFAAAAQQGWRG